MKATATIETDIFATLAKIIERHKWDEERCLMTGNLTAASIYAIKKEAVQKALIEITESAKND
jgi:hypothetical protein